MIIQAKNHTISLVFDLFQDQLPKTFPSSCSPASLRLGEEELRPISWSELKPHIDVFEETGEVRSGLFCGNDPVNRIDLDGLYATYTCEGSAGYWKAWKREFQRQYRTKEGKRFWDKIFSSENEYKFGPLGLRFPGGSRKGGFGGSNPTGHGIIIYDVQGGGYSVVGGSAGVQEVMLDNGQVVTYSYGGVGAGFGGKGGSLQGGEVYNVYEPSDYEGSFINFSVSGGGVGGAVSQAPGGGSYSWTAGPATPGVSGSYQWYSIQSIDNPK